MLIETTRRYGAVTMTVRSAQGLHADALEASEIEIQCGQSVFKLRGDETSLAGLLIAALQKLMPWERP